MKTCENCRLQGKCIPVYHGKAIVAGVDEKPVVGDCPQWEGMTYFHPPQPVPAGIPFEAHTVYKHPRFGPCVKCGGEDIALQYWRTANYVGEPPSGYMKCNCIRCGYTWEQPGLDALEKDGTKP